MVKKRKGIQSVEIGLSVLEALARLGKPGTLTEIAQLSHLTPSKAHRYLVSFVNTHFIRQDPESSRYDLGIGALRLGVSALGRLDVFDEAGRRAQELAEATGRAVLLAIWSELGPVIVRWFPGNPPIYTSLAVGSRVSVFHSATGRVFLSFQSDAFLTKLLKAELLKAQKKGFDIDAIREEIRRDLVAGVNGTLIPGLRAFASPIFDLQGQVVLVMSSVASDGLAASEDAAVKERLIAAARDITNRLGGRWPETR